MWFLCWWKDFGLIPETELQTLSRKALSLEGFGVKRRVQVRGLVGQLQTKKCHNEDGDQNDEDDDGTDVYDAPADAAADVADHEDDDDDNDS